ncbi:non-ribosomal peptide synthetase [Paenibacillus helianthi]|uniref:Non-ribosomal peptide synthetase n=1 Tax=Paenibacillus helianthi TaxID=1349432 RepID=A0ABX3EFZ9_9BACL|nr:non-ribosomal peptide synthetase [Paenibacillus helianthi]OKP79496.1 non-ribosomal peptide synthetase [Paenibacillus helianthi]
MKPTLNHNIILNSYDFRVEEQYWRDKLSGMDHTLSLIRNYSPPSITTESSSYEESAFEVPNQTFQLIKKQYSSHPVKLFLYLLSNYFVLIRRYKRMEDLIILTPVFHHPLPLNSLNFGLPLRTTFDESLNLAALMKLLKEVMKEATDHHNFPFAKIVEFLGLDQEKLTSVLDTAFMMEGMQDESALVQLPAALSFIVNESNVGITGRVKYRAGAYTTEFINTMIGHYLRLLEESAEDANKTIASMEMVTTMERHELLLVRNQTDRSYSLSDPIYRRIEQQAKQTPFNTAVVYGNESLTYHALNEKANALAWKLHDRGIGRGSYIPVLIGHGLNLPLALLAVMKTGAAFVPLDGTGPVERLRTLLADLDAHAVLISGEQPTDMELSDKMIVVDYTELSPTLLELAHTAAPEDPIYVIYTSGSTGKPKGAIIPHIGITNRFQWMDEHFGCSQQDAILQTTPHIYDSAVWQLFWPLLHGGRTVLPTPEFQMTLTDVLDIVSSQKITITDFVPSLFNLLVEQMEFKDNISKDMKSLRHLIIGGEEMTSRSVKAFQKRFPDIRMTNLYGPTETSIGVIYFEVSHDHEGAIPIGRPIANAKILLLDEHRNLTPLGQQGEIYITGHCLGLGYLYNPDKTAENFVENPYPEIGYSKLYKTGDLGRYDINALIRFEGRIDHQIKVNGHRVEIGEIEAALLANPELKEAAVIFNEQKRMLVAFYVPRDKGTTPNELNAYLHERLPRYMVPSLFLKLEKMPLMKSGKIDRKELAAISDRREPDTDYEPPRNQMEQQLEEIWKEVLGLSRVSINDSFLQIGGNSLLILKVHAQIVERIDASLTVAQLFTFHSIATLADFLERQGAPIKEAELELQTSQADILSLLRKVKEGVITAEEGAQQLE